MHIACVERVEFTDYVLPYPSVGCANGAAGLSLFHCSVSGPHRGGQLLSSLARCVQVGTQYQREGGGGDRHAS